jgi:hypothetical protein
MKATRRPSPRLTYSVEEAEELLRMIARAAVSSATRFPVAAAAVIFQVDLRSRDNLGHRRYNWPS